MAIPPLKEGDQATPGRLHRAKSSWGPEAEAAAPVKAPETAKNKSTVVRKTVAARRSR
jgi:hypothetical protein